VNLALSRSYRTIACFAFHKSKETHSLHPFEAKKVGKSSGPDNVPTIVFKLSTRLQFDSLRFLAVVPSIFQ